ncbi:hypothetical protein GOC76_23770 [Sinorhizobium medicae]|nr:hypothetical protein [Sinorhizobium medicae]
MANKLEIGVVADTSDAQKGIKDLEKDIEGVGKTAEKTSEQAAKSTDLWGQSLQGVKAALPVPADARGITAIGDAAITASRSTAIVETRMQKLSRVMRTFGTTILAGFSRAFSGLAAIGMAAGRLLGNALMLGLKATPLGVLLALGATVYQQLKKAFDKISGAAEATAKAITNAFSAGLEVEQFRAFEGLGKALQLSADEAADFASAMGPLQRLLKEGGEPAEQLAAAVKLLGGDLKALDPTNAQSVATFLASIQSSYKQLDQLQQKTVLEKLFPSASVETLAKIDQALDGTTLNVGELTAAIGENVAQSKEADRWNGQMATALGKLGKALQNLWDAWLKLTGIGPLFEKALGAVPVLTERVAQHIERVAEVVGKMPRLIAEAGKNVLAAFEKMFTDLTAAATRGWNAVWDAAVAAITAGINRVKQLFTDLAGWIEGKWAAIKASIPSFEDLNPFAQRQSVPVPFAAGGLRAAGVAYESPYSSLAGRAAPRAANSNGGLGAQMDQILFRWDEYTRQVEEAASVTRLAGTTITEAMKEAASGTDTLTRAASAANDNLSTISDTATTMQDDFNAWAENAVMGFVDAAIAGEDFRDVLAGILADLAKLVLQRYVFDAILPGAGARASAPAGLNAVSGAVPYGLGAPSDLGGLANIAGRSTAAAGTIDNSTTIEVGDVVVNMASGQVVATSEQGKRLGMQIEKAVQAVIIRESKPGGILRQVA